MTQAPMYRNGDTVILRSTRELGRVENDAIRSQGDYWYRVQFALEAQRWPELLKPMEVRPFEPPQRQEAPEPYWYVGGK